MVNMGMGNDNEINFSRTEWEIFIVDSIEIFSTLEHPAVNQEIRTIDHDLMAGSGYNSCGAVTSNIHATILVHSR